MRDSSAALSAVEAERVIESLRTGIPPTGQLRRFTVGRAGEIRQLEASLCRPEEHRGDALLVQANYGAGKTHLLRLIRELALDAGFAVALVTVDSRSGVRFNRMDQVAAAVVRAFELDASSGQGVRALFDAFCSLDASQLDEGRQRVHARISAGGRWDFSEELASPALFVALRAWAHAPPREVQDLVVDWLSYPWEYKSSRRSLYERLVLSLLPRARDPRPDAAFYADGVFVFDAQGHAQAWSALADLDRLASEAVREAGSCPAI